MTHRKTAIEEILDKHYQPRMHWAAVNRKNVLAAMEEHATEQVKISLEAIESYASQPEGREENKIGWVKAVNRKPDGWDKRKVFVKHWGKFRILEYVTPWNNDSVWSWWNPNSIYGEKFYEDDWKGIEWLDEDITKPDIEKFIEQRFPGEEYHKLDFIPPSKEQPAGVEQAAEEYVIKGQVSSASIDPKRDIAKRNAFIAGASWDAGKKENERLREEIEELKSRVEDEYYKGYNDCHNYYENK